MINVFSILLAAFCCVFFLFFGYLAFCLFCGKRIFAAIIVSIIALVFFVGAISLFYFFETPSETIEIDGYTYVLEEEPPKEVIEHNGYRYVLEENANA